MLSLSYLLATYCCLDSKFQPRKFILFIFIFVTFYKQIFDLRTAQSLPTRTLLLHYRILFVNSVIYYTVGVTLLIDPHLCKRSDIPTLRHFLQPSPILVGTIWFQNYTGVLLRNFAEY